jgi:glycosyltransferase involved in cell wall biosynthesis
MTVTAEPVGSGTPGVVPAPLRGRRVCFVANAVEGAGGQGEFLRQMANALDAIPGAAVFSRHAGEGRARRVNLPFDGSARRLAFDVLRATPLVRGRQDWLTLLADEDFDRRVAAAIGEADLIDGVIAQCADTLTRLRPRASRVVVTSLNTHFDHLDDVMEAEQRRTGHRVRGFVHPRMRQRAARELALADLVRVNSEMARRTFVERGVPADKVRVIHPAVDLDHFRPVPQPDAAFRVMAVASIDLRKGIRYLLQAFVDARLPNAELLLVGGTGDRWSRRMLEGYQRRDPRIRVAQLDVMRAPLEQSYGAATVVVHPALEDGYGLVIPQALACGRPVIASRGAGASELIEDGVTGFVVDAASSEAIRARLQLLAADLRLRERVAAEAPSAVQGIGYGDFARAVAAFYASAFC